MIVAANPRPRLSAARRRNLAAHLMLILAVGFTFTPLLWMLGSSLKAQTDVFINPVNPIPVNPTIENYRYVFERTNIARQFFNSVVFAGGVTLSQIVIAIPAAYAFARWRFTGDNVLFAILLLSMPIPFVVFYVPNYIMLSRMDLLNTFPGMILPQAASAFGIFLLRQHFRSFPQAVIEAARMDGAGEWHILWRIVLPNARGAIAALGIYVAISTWNEYVWPLLIAPDRSMHTLTVGTAQFAGGEGGAFWGAVMAAAVLASLATLIGYLLARRQILSVLAEGAVK